MWTGRRRGPPLGLCWWTPTTSGPRPSGAPSPWPRPWSPPCWRPTTPATWRRRTGCGPSGFPPVGCGLRTSTSARPSAGSCLRRDGRRPGSFSPAGTFPATWSSTGSRQAGAAGGAGRPCRRRSRPRGGRPPPGVEPPGFRRQGPRRRRAGALFFGGGMNVAQGGVPAYFFVNGRWLPPEQAVVPVEDRGYQLGDGVYEVIRVYGGRPFALDRHLERLVRSAAAIQLRLPLELVDLAAIVEEAPRRRGLVEAQVYLQVTRGVAARVHRFPAEAAPSLVVYASPVRAVDPRLYEEGAAAVVLPDQRWLRCDIKSINLLPNALAKEEARRQGALEAVLERAGVGVTEGASSNLFIVQEGTLVTAPPGPYILRGVTRDLVIEQARAAGVPVEERFFSRAELLAADEAFLT